MEYGYAPAVRPIVTQITSGKIEVLPRRDAAWLFDALQVSGDR
jgi:hypothetical protein